ncbi:sir2 family protein [Sarocladium implicatum]|nr:sir2 family protein [Sarocladium implicatum]
MIDTPTASTLDPATVVDFQQVLVKSKRIVALLGAGISASSGLATFRGTNGLWRNQDVTQVASPAGFRHDPGLVWQFYSYRRREALQASPNAAHYALAELARRVPGFVTLSQNVDNLSPRAGHAPDQLKLLHGNLFNVRCTDKIECRYVEAGNFEDPLTPALDPGRDEAEVLGRIEPGDRPKASPLLLAGIARKHAQILGEKFNDEGPSTEDLRALRSVDEDKSAVRSVKSDIRLSSGLSKEDLPHCPQCKTHLLRPSVVWFGEALPVDIVEDVDALFADPEPIDLFLAIGTSSQVWPAAGYALEARKKGARVAVVNMDEGDARKNMREGLDWVFVGDAAVVVPELLRPVIGDEEGCRR